MINILSIANDLSTLTQISRADSPNGAIDISLAGAKVQVKKVEKYHKNSKNNYFTIYGIDEVISNNYISTDMSIEEIREKLRNSPMPMLQAFYSLGIDTARQLISPYFFQCSAYMENMVEEVFNNSSTGIVDSNIINTLYNDAVTFALSGTKLLGDDPTKNPEDPFSTYEGKRKLFNKVSVIYVKWYPRRGYINHYTGFYEWFFGVLFLYFGCAMIYLILRDF
jgi:hypothetical protein